MSSSCYWHSWSSVLWYCGYSLVICLGVVKLSLESGQILPFLSNCQVDFTSAYPSLNSYQGYWCVQIVPSPPGHELSLEVLILTTLMCVRCKLRVIELCIRWWLQCWIIIAKCSIKSGVISFTKWGFGLFACLLVCVKRMEGVFCGQTCSKFTGSKQQGLWSWHAGKGEGERGRNQKGVWETWRLFLWLLV